MRASVGLVLLVGLTAAAARARAGEPKALTARQTCARLELTQLFTPEFTQRYRAVKTVDGKVAKEGMLEIHRSAGVTAFRVVKGPELGQDIVAFADAYGMHVTVNGTSRRTGGPADMMALDRPFQLARERLRRRWSLPPTAPDRPGWVISLGLTDLPEGGLKLDLAVGVSFGRGDDLLPGMPAEGTSVVPNPQAGTVRFTWGAVTADVRTRDGLLERWEVRQPDLRTVTLLEAISGGDATTAWATRIADARAHETGSATEVPLERLLPSAWGTFPALRLRGILATFADEVPQFWTELDRLQKAVDELIPAYVEARAAMEDDVPFVLEALILDVKKPFEALPSGDAPKGADRAAVLALLERSLRDLADARKGATGTGR